jgi:hypothetical protein
MEIEINYWAVLVCGIIAMALGAVWYGPIFGKKWIEIIGATNMDMERRKEMMKGVWKLYLINFILVLVQVHVLSWFIGTLEGVSSGIHTSLAIWAAFIMPTIAAGSMWNNDSAKVSWTRFLIQAGYQLVLLVIFGFILSNW